jgi:uncharacterized damage-inducible protein DinB
MFCCPYVFGSLNSPCVVFCALRAKGKSNQEGKVLYGRAIRHKLVELCFIGSFAFYLGYRFYLTNEFDETTFFVNYWLDNERWYKIKLLVDAIRSDADRTKSMANDTYANAIKKVCTHLMIASKHWLHLGRSLGSKILEFLEELKEEIRTLGNWDPKIQEKSYSTKLPWRPMRKLAGFTTGNNMNYNPRTTVEPPASLIEKTPFHRFSTPLEYVEAKIQNDEADVWTALEFLKLMKLLGVVFLQDAAAMWVLHPERKEHPMFSMPVFQDPEWLVSILCAFLFFACCFIFRVCTARVVLFVYFVYFISRVLFILFYFIFRACCLFYVYFISRVLFILFYFSRVLFILCLFYFARVVYFILFYFSRVLFILFYFSRVLFNLLIYFVRVLIYFVSVSPGLCRNYAC